MAKKLSVKFQNPFKRKKIHSMDPNIPTDNEQIHENEVPTAEQQAADNDMPSEVEQLQLQIDELNNRLADTRDKYLRLNADFDNFRKRAAKERLELIQNAAADTFKDILPLLDDFDRAVKAADKPDTAEPIGEGVRLIFARFKSILEQRGVKEMDANLQPFDPELHEAITEIPAPTEALKGKIVDTIIKGYYLNDKIIRYAQVIVGK